MNRGTLLGAFFFVGLTIFIVVTFTVKKFDLGAKSQIQVEFDHVIGLQTGDEVRVYGVKQGQVDAIEIADGKVVVSMSLASDVKIRDGYEIKIKQSSYLGGTVVTIDPGQPEAPESSDRPYKGGYLADGIEKIGNVVDENSESIAGILENTKEVTRRLAEGEGSVGKALTDEALYDELRDAATNVRKISEKIEKGEGSIGKAVNDPKLYDDLAEAVAHLKEVAQKIKDGEGTIGRLVNEDELYQQIEEITKNVEEASKNVKDISEQVRSGEGTVGELIYDKEMAENLKNTFENLEAITTDLRELTDDLKNKDGLLNALITDEELTASVKKSLQGMEKSVGRMGQYQVWMGGSYSIWSDLEASASRLFLRLEPDENKYFQAGVTFLGLDTDSQIDYEDKVDDESATEVLGEIQIAYRFPEITGEHLWIRGGLIEGRPGGGVDWVYMDFYGEHDLKFSLEIRDAYNDLDRDDLDENIDGAMVRAYARARLWDHVLIDAGMNNIGDDPEFYGTIGFEYRDKDLLSLVALLGLSG
jgi:phospholipid/cholesterol/gamma-HCH transport system substrate-binding protein